MKFLFHDRIQEGDFQAEFGTWAPAIPPAACDVSSQGLSGSPIACMLYATS
jgi:hypothetical protein